MEKAAFIYDRLYGDIRFGSMDLLLFQTKEMARLRHVSLSAVPSWTVPAGVCASRFEHSVGAGHLARIVGARRDFQDYSTNLYFAALSHDLGTPPFSHSSEYFLVKLFGKNHEVFAQDVLAGSEFAKEVRRQGGNIDTIMNLIAGNKKPLSDLINGSLDIDNLDNTLRYGLSMGILRTALYSPEKLAQSFSLDRGRLSLNCGDISHLWGWGDTRGIVYKFVYGEANLSPGMMLFRALDFAERDGELGRDFFRMTDVEAFLYLSNKCNMRTRTLMERADRWLLYPRAFNLSAAAFSEETVKFILHAENRGMVADEVGTLLGIEPENVCVYMGKDKGFRRVDLPVMVGGVEGEFFPSGQSAFMVQVYVHPKHFDGHTKAKIGEFLKDRLKLPPSS